MILIVGDLHGEFNELNKIINKKNLDIILQCGDFGYWPRWKNKSKLKNEETKVYFCDGNHEDHHSLLNLKDNEIFPNVFYMKRGSTLTLPDKRNVLFIGGALSIDKDQRVIGESWFPEETITQKDVMNLPDIKIDIVISHTAPGFFKIFRDDIEDPSRKALNYVFDKYLPSLWYFGHMHKFKEDYYRGCHWTVLSCPGNEYKWWIELK